MLKPSSRAIAFAVLSLTSTTDVQACGSEPFIGEICLFPYNFCPRGYAETAGQIMSIAQNTALFSLLGTTFGGNGQTTFALPDLRGRTAVHNGQGPGLSPISLGEMLGSETQTLTINQMPAHSHTATTTVSASSQLMANISNGSTDTPAGAVLARQARTNIYGAGPAATAMDASAITTTATATTTVAPAGANQPFSTRDPSLGLTYCIALEGIYPSRN